MIYTAIQNAITSIERRKSEIMGIACVMGIRYHDSAQPKGGVSSWEELMACLGSLTYAAEKQYHENMAKGKTSASISVASGGWLVTANFWDYKTPSVKICFGVQTF